MEKINAYDVAFLFSVDLKVANFLCGIGSHSSKFPCFACEVEDTALASDIALATSGMSNILSKMLVLQLTSEKTKNPNITKIWQITILFPLQPKLLVLGGRWAIN